MALSSSTIWEVETTGSDTLNGGAFDPSKVSGGGFADGAATVANTSAPVFTSASYNFVAGDVGAWVYIQAGTNWTFGWYKIASVASNAATLNGTIGQGVIAATLRPTTVVGCATTASPAGAVWSIDYSQQAAAQFAYTDLASAGTGLTVSSAAKPFAKQHVGNCIVITGGTNFNAGRYVIASISGVTATVVGPTNITTGAGVSGTGGQGGAFLSPAMPAGIKVGGNAVFIQTGTYSITSASTNVAGGCVLDTKDGSAIYRVAWEGYSSVRGDLGTPPLLQASGISTATLFSYTTAGSGVFSNISVDGAGLTSIQGFNFGRRCLGYKLSAINCTNVGLNGNAVGVSFDFCKASNITGGAAAIIAIQAFNCEAYSNTVPGFTQSTTAGPVYVGCLSYSNSGASSDGFLISVNEFTLLNCVAYGNGRDGFRSTNGEPLTLNNCIAETNTGTGFNATNATAGLQMILANCAAYNNGTNFSANIAGFNLNPVTGTSTFFINAAGGNFALNNTATGGGLVRSVGFPGTFPAGTSTGYPDIGAVQHKGGSGPLGIMGVM